jgi:hypothetical protein
MTKAFHPGKVFLSIIALLAIGTPPAIARDKNGTQYGTGLVINIPAPVNEVSQVVEEIAQNGIIHGSKEYNKDEFISGAASVDSSKAFPAWGGEGKVFYKERRSALNPRNFKDSNDLGTLTVRYVVQPQRDKNTILRIDAVFVEDFRHITHTSNGSVETAEYKDIQEHLEAIELVKKQTIESEKEHQQQLAKTNLTLPNQSVATNADASSSRNNSISSAKIAENASSSARDAAPRVTSSDMPRAQNVTSSSISRANSSSDSLANDSAPVTSPTSATENASNSVQATESTDDLEQHVKDLRRQLEWIVKSPGAALKSSPFRSARTLTSLPSESEVLLLIATPYWYGVETHEGQRGWISRDDLEQAP